MESRLDHTLRASQVVLRSNTTIQNSRPLSLRRSQPSGITTPSTEPRKSSESRVDVTTPTNLLTSTFRNCLQQAIGYLHRAQQPEGGWVGSWSICFTYAAQFALESLSLVGERYETSEYPRKGCEFLLKHQREDGGWGESWEV
jgi:hypothetical protein